jgi:hypothetical protein
MRASVVALLLAAFSLSGPRAATAEPSKAKLSLERSEDLEMALEAFGFDEVRVFIWRGGILEGKINLQEGQDIKPLDLNGSVLETVKDLLSPGEAIDSSLPRPVRLLEHGEADGSQALRITKVPICFFPP